MNYVRIYEAFIQDRRCKEAATIGYSERHHIKPRALGGGNEATNLIDLTPEDHFFAHLLLAKIHGGRMWAPVAFMVSGQRKDYKPIKSRKSYGWAARAMAKSRSGRNAPQFDATIYDLKHQDGRRWSGCQPEMHQIGLDKPGANMLVRRRLNSMHGWTMADYQSTEIGRGCRKLSRHPMYRHERHKFRHVDGRTFEGTQFEFHKVCGVSKAAASNLVRGKATTALGWFIDGTEIVQAGRARKWANLKTSLEQNATLSGASGILGFQKESLSGDR